MKRIAEAAKKKYDDERFSATADTIAMLTGFAPYDALANAGHNDQEIINIIARLVRLAASNA